MGKGYSAECHLISTQYRPVPLVHQAYSYWNGECKQVIRNGDIDTHAYKYVYFLKAQMNGPIKDKESATTILTNFLDHIENRDLFQRYSLYFSRKQCEKLAKMIKIMVRWKAANRMHKFV